MKKKYIQPSIEEISILIENNILTDSVVILLGEPIGEGDEIYIE